MADKDWKTGLFQCKDSPVMFIWAWCVPCGFLCMQTLDAKLSAPEDKNAAIIACLCGWYLGCIGVGYNRHILRSKLNIKGNIFVDILLECFLCCCAVSQEWRETMEHKSKGKGAPIWEVLKA
jgi:Cys-rich protein (TIGR01571 family)